MLISVRFQLPSISDKFLPFTERSASYYHNIKCHRRSGIAIGYKIKKNIKKLGQAVKTEPDIQGGNKKRKNKNSVKRHWRGNRSARGCGAGEVVPRSSAAISKNRSHGACVDVLNFEYFPNTLTFASLLILTL